MPECVVVLDIDADALLHYYGGRASAVQTRAVDGRIIQFPASALRPFVTSSGVQGTFKLIFDEKNHLVSMKKVP